MLQNEMSLLAKLFLESDTGKVRKREAEGTESEWETWVDEFNVLCVNGNAVNTERKVLCRLKRSSENYVYVIFMNHKQTAGWNCGTKKVN